jgi:hypothetical protein
MLNNFLIIMQVFKTHTYIIKIRVIDMVVQDQPLETCKIPGVLWPALYGSIMLWI